MKIIDGKYKQEHDILKYISFFSTASPKVSLVFLERLAAWVRDYYPNKVLWVLSGFRTYEQQVASYEKYPDLAAKPNTSWHQFHCAIDVGAVSQYMLLADYAKTYREQSLYKYGLYIPMNLVDSPNMLEKWHIIPIECRGVSAELRKYFLDDDDMVYESEEYMATIADLEYQVKILTANVETQKGYNATLRTALDAERRITKAQALEIETLKKKATTLNQAIATSIGILQSSIG